MSVGEHMTATDKKLAKLSLAGSLAAFEVLVIRHEAAVYRYVCQRCGNAEEAKDLTQAAFLAAFRKLRQFSSRHSFRSWLFAIARNKAIDFLRSRRLHDQLDAEQLVEPTDPASSLEQVEQVETVWSLARNRLSVAQFETLWLRYQEDLSIREIAQAMSRTETGVKVCLFRARQQLAPLLRAQEEPTAIPWRKERGAVTPEIQSLATV